MDQGGFYVYNGAVQPLPCSVLEHVFTNLNVSQRFKVFAAENNDYSEVIWFYPVGEGNTDITNYVSYNYAENLWAVGTLARGTWGGRSIENRPLATSAIDTAAKSNILYEHEVGFDDDGSAMTAFVESGDLEIGDGDSFMFIKRIIPDFSFTGQEGDASIDLTLKGSDFPLEEGSTLTTSTISNTTKQSHVRARARHTKLRVESNGLGYGWRLGNLRFDMRQDGRR